jgi:hypothetical protein
VRFLASRWGWGVHRVLRFLEIAEKNGEIKRRTEQGETVITLCNYDRYNRIGNTGGNTDGNTGGNTGGNKEYKEYKEYKEKNVLNTPPTPSNERNKKTGTEKSLQDSGGEISEVEVLDETDFENVWAMYGRKGNKKTCMQKWGKLKNHCKLAALQHIPRYVAATPDIQYRKNFETYINQEAWNDEVLTNLKKQNDDRNRISRDTDILRAVAEGCARAYEDQQRGI